MKTTYFGISAVRVTMDRTLGEQFAHLWSTLFPVMMAKYRNISSVHYALIVRASATIRQLTESPEGARVAGVVNSHTPWISP